MKNRKFKRARAVAAVEELQRQSVQVDTNKLSPKDIATEIKAMRETPPPVNA
ncbi:MAG TPA: hypothetical protein VN666_07915 [Nitrospira sp.]|nr:hypothetical protein [Nitrospira sp.]